MKIGLSVVAAAALVAAPPPAAASSWDGHHIAVLRSWIAAAPSEGLPHLSTSALDKAQRQADTPAIDKQADALALRLAEMHLLGAAISGERTGWDIADSDREIDLAPMLARAIADGKLVAFFAGTRPAHPDYEHLRRALLVETDPTRRSAIARNMERWRWMPRSLGNDFLIVNVPAFELKLWRGGREAGSWRVIVGKRSTPTPVFAATVTGVNLNPWWYVPDSIVQESVGALVRRDPAAATARGYVWSGGVYRQKPGPNNALGQMKLVMPNNYRVYLHDTPNKALFDEDVRTFSHGCIRVDKALNLAETLLAGRMTRAEIDAVVETRQTTTVDLPRNLPIYVTYFTAFAGADGSVTVAPDIYRRDARIRDRAVTPPPRAVLLTGEGCSAPS